MPGRGALTRSISRPPLLPVVSELGRRGLLVIGKDDGACCLIKQPQGCFCLDRWSSDRRGEESLAREEDTSES